MIAEKQEENKEKLNMKPKINLNGQTIKTIKSNSNKQKLFKI